MIFSTFTRYQLRFLWKHIERVTLNILDSGFIIELFSAFLDFLHDRDLELFEI